MSIQNAFGRTVTYLSLFTALCGCNDFPRQTHFENRLESRVQAYSLSAKAQEARQDIERILASEYFKWLKEDSGLIFNYSSPKKQGSYLFKYTYGEKTTIDYYCNKRNNKFDRYAQQIILYISAEPYFFEITFLGNEDEGVNPDKPMRAIFRRYKIEMDNRPPDSKQRTRSNLV
jgi:hypothetical protein